MRAILAVLCSTMWISLNEFLRNQVLLLDRWSDKYSSMGLTFPGDPVNGAIWGVWALCLSVLLHFLSRRTSLPEAAVLGWLFGFVLMWLVIGNLGVLPFGILPYAIPWSMIEVAGAVWMDGRLSKRPA